MKTSRVKISREQKQLGGGVVHGINYEDVKVTTSSLTCLECWCHSCKLQFREFNCKDTSNKEQGSWLGKWHWRKQEPWRVCKVTTGHFTVILWPPCTSVTLNKKRGALNPSFWQHRWWNSAHSFSVSVFLISVVHIVKEKKNLQMIFMWRRRCFVIKEKPQST